MSLMLHEMLIDGGLKLPAFGTPEVITGHKPLAIKYSTFHRLWVMIGFSGTVHTSPDAINWTRRSAAFTNKDLYALGVNDTTGKLIGVHNAIGFVVSTDAINWTIPVNLGGSWNFNLGGAHYSPSSGMWVSVQADGTIRTSLDDGVTWTLRTSGTTGFLRSVYRDETTGMWMAVGGAAATGTILTSSDGITWTVRQSTLANGLNEVHYNGTIWCVVGTGGHIRTSTDGLTWTNRASGVTTDLEHVYYANGLWVAVGKSGRIVTSPNGTTWTTRVSPTTQPLHGVHHNSVDGLWVAIGTNSGIAGTSVVIHSLDGISWW